MPKVFVCDYETVYQIFITSIFLRSLLLFMCQNLFLQNGNFVSQVMNKYEFVPKMPNSSDLELVFDTSFHDVQPHLFKVSSSRSKSGSPYFLRRSATALLTWAVLELGSTWLGDS